MTDDGAPSSANASGGAADAGPVRARAFKAPPSDEPETAPLFPASRASTQSARPGAIRQAARLASTPTGLRFLGFVGSLGVALGGSRAFGLLGVAVLAGAWYGLRRGTEVRWLLVTGALWAVPLLFGPPLFSGDLAAYACQGQLYGHGLSPYGHGVADLPCGWLPRVPRLWWHTPTPYGPGWVVLSALGAAAGRWWVAVGVLRLVALAGIALVIGYGRRLVELCGADPGRAAWLGAISPLVLLHGISGGHNDALLAGLVVAGLAIATRDRWGIPTGVAFGLAVGVKVTALVAVPFAIALIARERRAAPLARATVGVVVGLIGTFAGVTGASGLGLGWVPALSHTTDLIQWTSLPTGVGMAAGYVLRGVGRADLAPAALTIARGVGLLALAALLVTLWWRARTRAEAIGNAGLALAATALLGPVFFPWYALVPLAVLSATAWSEWARDRLGLVVIGLALLVLPDGTGLASLTKPIGAFGDLALVIVLVAVLVRRYRAGRARPTPTTR